MTTVLSEPDSPVLLYDDDDDVPELDGARHLSVSSDGTIDSLVSQGAPLSFIPAYRSTFSVLLTGPRRSRADENPTPPQSPGFGPVVHISPPEGHLPGLFEDDGGELDDGRTGESQAKDRTPLADPIAFLRTPFVYDAGPPTPGGIKVDIGLSSPTEPAPTTPVLAPEPVRPSNLAARRAASGSLPSNTLAGLQRMRFEASRDAGMGLGVEPGTPGDESMEGVSPAGSGATLRPRGDAGVGRGGSTSSRPTTPLLPAGTDKFGTIERAARRMPSLVLKLPRGFGSTPSPLSSPSTVAPPSPHISRSSAFILGTSGPRTPLTPSHLPPAPALGSGGPAFEWHSYSFPDSPGCPAAPTGVPVAERTCYFGEVIPPSPTLSDRTAYLPTPGSEKARTPSAVRTRTPMPASPLGQGRFEASAASEPAGGNPFFP